MQFLVFLALAIGALCCLGASAIFGGHHDGDMGHEVGGHEPGHDIAPSFLSPRVLFAFLLGFSTTGAIATLYGAGAGVATLIGLVPGLGVGALTWGITAMFYKQQANSSVKPGQVIGTTGTVTSAIPSGGIGEVNVVVNGQLINYSAVAADGTSSFKAGTAVTVVKDFGGQVSVKQTGVEAQPTHSN